jgi:protein-tyrosine phosphatase
VIWPAQELDIAGLQVPRQFYLVLREPALLVGMAYPVAGVPWRQLFNAGISNVVCLCGKSVDYDPAPLRMLQAVDMEDLHHGNEPRFPARDERLVREAVEIITGRLRMGEGVAVHCVGGTGRTGTVIGCVLRSMGFPADDIIRYLDELNRARGKRGWPESPWQAEMIRHFP